MGGRGASSSRPFVPIETEPFPAAGFAGMAKKFRKNLNKGWTSPGDHSIRHYVEDGGAVNMFLRKTAAGDSPEDIQALAKTKYRFSVLQQNYLGSVKDLDSFAEMMTAQKQGLDRLFDKHALSMEKNFSVFRGASVEMLRMPVGTEFTDAGFTSTSASVTGRGEANRGASFYGSFGRTVEIRAPAGTKYLATPQDNEVILNRGNRYRVIAPGVFQII